jgi:dihydroxyacetone kinase
VQPVLDKYCSGCHNGQEGRPNLVDATIIQTSGGISPLPKSYLELHPFVRRNGPEGDYHTLTSLEFHADTNRLIQMLRKGHHNVQLDAEGWDRLITWIDLNVPAYGTYHEISPIPGNFEKHRYEAKKKYAGVEEDIEAIPLVPAARPQFVQPEPEAPRPARLALAGWPFSAAEVRRMQHDLSDTVLRVDLGHGVETVFRWIPAGQFVMGDVNGEKDEFPTTAVKIDRPFWMTETEVSLEQYQQFDPNHRNGYCDLHYKDQVKPGYLMDSPQKPVIRVSWHQAMAFCEWLSARTGRPMTLPTEAQWEWACRAGTDTPMFYGDLDSDFSRYANLADATIKQLAVVGVDPQPISNPDRFWDFVPKDERFNDGVLHLADCGKYEANAWGLRDLIGNVAEWTPELLEGFAIAHQGLVTIRSEKIVCRATPKGAEKVALVTLGGAGHEPALSGFVGKGMLDYSVVGDIFAAPGPPKVLEALRLSKRPAGTLFVVLNHAGDVLSANMAMEMANKEGIRYQMLLTHEDIAPGADAPAENRRGLVGCIPLYKIAGAAAEAGKSLDEVYSVAQRFNNNVARLAVAMKTATHPAGGQAIFELADDKMEIGMGQHGEAGTGPSKIMSADQTAEMMLSRLLAAIKAQTGDKVLVVINGSGATTLMEM